MMEAKNTALAAETEQKQLKMKISHLEKEIPIKKKELEALGKTSSKLQQEYDAANTQLSKLQQLLSKIPFNDEKESNLLSERKELQIQARQLTEQADNLSARLSRLNFNYKDPHNGFDRSKVKGLVAKLIEVKNPQRDAVALEVTAGSRLYNVVVDTEDTAADLINKGKLVRRVTIIPLNKINAYTIPSSSIKKAQQLAGGPNNAMLALSLVGSDKEVTKAAEYVFGSTIVCPSMDIAQIVAKGIKTRCVTSDGEVYETGTLTGGSRSTQQPILRQLWQLNDTRRKLDIIENRLREITEELRHSQQYNELKQKLSIKEHEVQLLLQRLSSTASHQLQTKINQMEEDLQTSKELILELAKREKDAKSKAKELESQSSNAESQHDARIKQLEKNIANAKKAATDAIAKQKNAQQQQEMLLLEVKEQRDDVKAAESQLESIENTILSLQQQTDKLENLVAETNELFSKESETLEQHRKQIQKANEDIQILVEKQQSAQKRVDEIVLEVKKAEHSIEKLIKNRTEAENNIKNMVSKYQWIEEEKKYVYYNYYYYYL